MLAAGYPGAGEMFTWETGLGVPADQASSVRYKRQKAADLADRIRAYRANYPGAPVSLIGLSAGTAVVAFVLEALPEDCPVDNVVLLGASISADYDLTQALRRVRNRLTIFTSEKDAVLGVLVPAAGTADRSGSIPAGTRGFVLPPGTSDETRRLYAEKVVTIAWSKDFERSGNYGGHLDNVKEAFVRDHVAPRIMPSTGAP